MIFLDGNIESLMISIVTIKAPQHLQFMNTVAKHLRKAIKIIQKLGF